MAEIRTSLVIGAKATEAIRALEEVKKALGGLAKGAADSGTAAAGSFGKTRSAIESISDQLSKARQFFVAFQAAQGAAQTVRGVFATADAYTNLTARLKLALAGQTDLNTALASVRSLADRNLAPLAETSAAFTRITATVRNLQGGFRESLALTEALTLSLRLSGATAEEQASALLQFAQGLQSNFQGDEFRALTENAPRLLKAVADGLGVNEAALKGMSSAGKLTADVVSNALLKSLQGLRTEAQGLPVTVAGAFEVLKNAALVYTGQVDQARGTSSTLAQAILVVARNFKTLADTLTIVVGLIAALGIGRLVAAMAGLAAAGGTVAGVFGRLIGLLGGPVGLIASLAAAALGFTALGTNAAEAAEKQRRANEEAEHALEIERDRALLSGKGDLPPARSRVSGRITGPGAPLEEAFAVQAAPKSTEQATEGLSTRTGILRDSEKRRKEIIDAFAARTAQQVDVLLNSTSEVAKARARQSIKELLAEQQEALAAERKQTSTSLAGLSDPIRIPQLKELYSQAFNLTKDELERERGLLDKQLEANLISYQDYFTQKALLAERDFSNEEKKLLDEENQLAAHLVRLAALRGKDANQREQVDEARQASEQRLTEVQTQLRILQRSRGTAASNIGFEARARQQEQADQQATLRERLAELRGEGGGAVVRDRLEREFRAQRAQLTLSGDQKGLRLLDQVIDTEGKKADLEKLEAAFNQAITRMGNAEQSINVQKNAGLITESQARTQILDLYRATAGEVEGLIPQMQELAAAIGNPQSVNNVAAMRNKVLELKTATDEVAVSVNGAVRDGFQGLFEDISRGAKSAKDIVLDFTRSLEQAITRIAARQVADSLFAGSKGGGLGGIIAGLFNRKSALPSSLTSPDLTAFSEFHQGGIVGGPAPRRMVNPLAFVGAPRYHAGGILGLKPDEVGIVGKVGEEMLTRDDPRHSLNGGGRGVTMIVNTPDAASFRKSRSQIEADMAMMMARARRNT